MHEGQVYLPRTPEYRSKERQHGKEGNEKHRQNLPVQLGEVSQGHGLLQTFLMSL